jgi:transcription elongation factor Elf1
MADLVLQQKYISLLGAQLDGFKQRKPNCWWFRCPICGDSETDKKKRRGYIYLKNGEYWYYCHNCGQGQKFERLLYATNGDLYSDYRKENLITQLVFSDKKAPEEIKTKQWIFEPKPVKSIADLPESHPAYQYLVSRCIPKENFSKVKWADDYPTLVRSTIPEKYDDTKMHQSGILFELFNKDSDLVGYQLRSIDPSVKKQYRFCNASIGEERGFFGSLDLSQPHFVVEGCMDALSIPNTMAVVTSDLSAANVPTAIYFNDQEPRNSQIVKQIEKEISLGYSVVLLPDEYIGMDANDLLKRFGDSTKEFLLNHVYSGLKAKIKLAGWRK